ncbi:MAG: tRNA (5-methylaminomethyl-2-thiouridine)(34)-methyltransferase MnmD [Alphaproteobacteria bacterium]|nr:tRNA (5-methylaminomethyl-2-thiouridine)(34)-methyltransferase MnmD [Alphaproteobacteria bacterium]
MPNDDQTRPLGTQAEGVFASGGPGVRPASIEWTASSAGPRSADFGDIYFAADGLAESRHVFIGGSRIAERIAAGGDIVIAETGFGSGLNFLAAWDAWLSRDMGNCGRLTFVSCEFRPMRKDDLARSHATFPEISALSARLVDAYPALVAGPHDIDLDEGVRLRLIFDEAAAFRFETFTADAWFLDGFAPSRNPEMWRCELLAAVAARSRPGTRAATFTVAGAVRRGLQCVGFDVEKRPGFGQKREMLTATFVGPSRHD